MGPVAAGAGGYGQGGVQFFERLLRSVAWELDNEIRAQRESARFAAVLGPERGAAAPRTADIMAQIATPPSAHGQPMVTTPEWDSRRLADAVARGFAVGVVETGGFDLEPLAALVALGRFGLESRRARHDSRAFLIRAFEPSQGAPSIALSEMYVPSGGSLVLVATEIPPATGAARAIAFGLQAYGGIDPRVAVPLAKAFQAVATVRGGGRIAIVLTWRW